MNRCVSVSKLSGGSNSKTREGEDSAFAREEDVAHKRAEMKSVLETIKGGTQYLEKRGIEDARRNMEHLVAHRLDCDRMAIYTQFDRPLEESELDPLRADLKRRGEGVPLQHILGFVWFHDRKFSCDGRALIPRPETEELAGMVLGMTPHERIRVLDMGCGSGVLGLTIAAERVAAEVVLADISDDALGLAEENAGLLGIGNARFVKSDLFSGIDGKFDFILANLPYVPIGESRGMARELEHDPELALFSGEDGLDLIRRFIPEAADRLKDGGILAMEIGHDQASRAHGCLESCGFAEIEIRRDLSGIARLPFAKYFSSIPANNG